MKNLTLLFLCIILLASCSHPNPTVQEVLIASKETTVTLKEPVPVNFIPRPLTIVAAGDSLTEGIGDSTNQGGYLTFLSRLIESEQDIREVTIQNFGVKGNRSDQLLKKLNEREVQSAIAGADLVSVTIGGNDIMKIVKENILDLELAIFQSEQTAYSSRIKNIIDSIRSTNYEATVVLIGFYNPFNHWFSDIKELNEIVEIWNNASREVVDQYPNTFLLILMIFFLIIGKTSYLMIISTQMIEAMN